MDSYEIDTKTWKFERGSGIVCCVKATSLLNCSTDQPAGTLQTHTHGHDQWAMNVPSVYR